MNLDSLFDLQESQIGQIPKSVRERLEAFLNTDKCAEQGWVMPSIGDVELDRSGSIDVLHLADGDSWGVWKQPIFTGLIANQLVRNTLNRETELIAEGGGVSTAYCLNALAKNTEIPIAFVTSRFYPTALLKKLVSEDVHLILAPENPELSIEEEFYTHLVHFISDKRREGVNISSPWHVKWSQFVAEIYADFLLKKHSTYFSELDYFIVSVGSGSTLALAKRIKSKFPKIRLVVAEPEEAPLISKKIGLEPKNTPNSTPIKNSDYLSVSVADKRIKHLTFGPHYEKLNPRINSDLLSSVDEIHTYSKDDWQNESMRMRAMDRGVGNSTAAGLSIAGRIKEKHRAAKVLTVIYEPLQPYCLEG